MKKLLTILFVLTCFFAKAQDTAIDRMGRAAIIKSTGTTLSPDTTNYKVGVFNSTGKLFKMNWPVSGGGSTTPAGNNSNLQINQWGSFGTPASDSLSWDGANGALVNKGVYQGNPATSDVVVLDGAGNRAFRGTNANNWLTPTATQFFQIGGFNSPVAFTAQGGTTMAQSQFASGKFQITAGTYNLAALPTDNFELINSADLLKFSIDDSGSVVAKGRLSTDSTLHTLGITQVPVLDTANYKPDVVDAAGKHFKSYWPTAASTVPISGLRAATATNSVNHAGYIQTWDWNTFVSGGSSAAFNISSSSTTKTGVSTLMKILSSGAQAASNVQSVGLNVSSTISGTSSTNTGISIGASGGTINYPLIAMGGNSGFGTTTPTSTLQVTGSLALSTVTKTATYTATSSDYTIICSTNTFTIDLPTAVGITGRVYVIKNVTSGTTITVDGSGTETIDGATTYTLAAQYKLVMIQSTGTEWVVIGNN